MITQQPEERARLNAFLERERTRVDQVLARPLDAAEPEPLVDAARYALQAGGKRLRPILCVAGYRAVDSAGSADEPAPESVYRLACSLELIHTYSLVHDDLPSMDDDAVRRGRPATHVAHGEAVATLAAAALIPMAVREVLEAAGDLGLDAMATTALVAALCRAAGAEGMVGGQARDLEAEGAAVSLESLETIHRLKTGALLAAGPVMGGIAAGASREVVEALKAYGHALGLAFQIADDILDVTGDTARLGKTAGRDQDLAKATFPALAGLDEARRRAVAEVDRALEALEIGGVRSEELVALAHFAVARDR